MMRKHGVCLLLSTSALAMTACGDSNDPVAACENLATSTCHRMYQCYSPSELSAHGLPLTEGECVAKVELGAGCATATWENLCPVDEHADQAQFAACADAVDGASCASLDGDHFGVAACANLCVGGGTTQVGGGGGDGTGEIDVSWTIDNGGLSSSCAALGAVSVELQVVQGGTDVVLDQIAACDAFGAPLTGIAPGSYTVWGILEGGDGHRIGGGYAEGAQVTANGDWYANLQLEVGQ